MKVVHQINFHVWKEGWIFSCIVPNGYPPFQTLPNHILLFLTSHYREFSSLEHRFRVTLQDWNKKQNSHLHMSYPHHLWTSQYTSSKLLINLSKIDHPMTGERLYGTEGLCNVTFGPLIQVPHLLLLGNWTAEASVVWGRNFFRHFLWLWKVGHQGLPHHWREKLLPEILARGLVFRFEVFQRPKENSGRTSRTSSSNFQRQFLDSKCR